MARPLVSLLSFLALAAVGCRSGGDSPPAVCGDGQLDEGETCDDGNTADGDGCAADCTVPADVCGDAMVGRLEACDDGNPVAGDGCEADCTRTPGVGPVVTFCPAATAPPLGGATCAVIPGDDRKLLTGTILTPGEVLRGGQVLVDAAGRITCVACDCSAEASGATAIDCPTGIVSPGLINAHDHITYAHNSPYIDSGERYEQRHDWRKGLRGHTRLSYLSGASEAQIRWGELRFLLGGATATIGSGGATGLLRNLDTSMQEGLAQGVVEYETFPLGDSDGTQLASGCAYPSVPTAASIAAEPAYFPHISEGIDGVARNEFLCVSTEGGGAHDLVQPQSAFTHSIALSALDYAQMAADGTALVWSPRSNITLYGNTAVVTAAARLGVLIALGTDWMPSGSMNLLRELACADALNQVYYGRFFTDEQLWLMATANVAAASATDDAIGVIALDRVADLAIFAASGRADHRAVLEAEAEDVVLVLRGGKPLYGDDAAIGALAPGACDALEVCGAAKRVCLQSEIGMSFAQLEAAAGSLYPAFFCGLPEREPSCVPSRPSSVEGSTTYTGSVGPDDPDGDGVPTSLDGCPTVFDPVRPVDGGAQADSDGDGDGDACDVCPLEPDSLMCSGTIDPNDTDGDGVPNAGDNCPGVANADQADGDGDQKGDACDACPADANPGTAPCPATIYDLKSGAVPLGTAVGLADVLVTGRATDGFFVQVKEGDPDYAGPDYSGIFVADAASAVLAGDRVSVTTAIVANVAGRILLANPTVVIESSAGEAAPVPVLETSGNLAGSRAAALESVVVRVVDATVTEVSPDPEYGFVLDGVLGVEDALYALAPVPAVGTSFASLAGILERRDGLVVLEPRDAGDVVPGAVTLVAFGPAQSWAREGQLAAPTFPAPLTVTLSWPAVVDTFIAVSSGTPAQLAVAGGGVTVLAGQRSAPVLVDGLLPAPANVTLTATLDAVSFDAAIRVLGATEPAALASLSPASATVFPGGTVTMTVALDLPAPPGGVVVDLALSPASAGTVPSSVTVAADQLQATFAYTHGGTAPEATITASFGGDALSATVSVITTTDHLVVNELDYEQPGTDTAEFVEIWNGTGVPVDLGNLVVVFMNGADNAEYDRVTLAGTLAPDQYLVIGGASVTAAPGALKITFSASIQNGPDAVGIVDVATGTLVDALSYEGAITAGSVTGVGVLDFVEGTPLGTTPEASGATSAGSLIRSPNGRDADDAATDWAFTTTTTPGAVNVP